MSAPFTPPEIPFTLGQTVTLTAPASVLNTAAVVIQNQSPYLLAVNVAGADFTLAPYSVDRFATAGSGQPIQVTSTNPDNVPDGLPSYLVGTWYNAGDEPPAGAFPTSLTPSPYALGLTIAEQILANGVPSVMLTDVLVTAQAIAPGTTFTLPTSISRYASVAVFGITQVATVLALQVQQSVQADGQFPIRTDVLGDTSHALPIPYKSNLYSVESNFLRVFNFGPATAYVTVVASNRQPVQRTARSQNPQIVDEWAIASTVMVAGNAYPVTAVATPTGVSRPALAGPVYCRVRLTAATAARGYLAILDCTGNEFIIADTSEMAAYASGFVVEKLISVPDGYIGFVFHCTTAGTTAVDVTMLPSS